MAKIDEMAEAYLKGHSTGNSYIDEKVRQAYLVGAREAVGDLSEWLGEHLTPFYQQLTENHLKKTMG